MITFTKLGSYGRLGNQLFQYAILLAVGAERGFTVKIPDFKNSIWHGQKCLLDNFNISASYLSSEDKINYRYVEPENKNFTYLSNVFDVPDNTDFFGFFQNYSYYKNHVDLIRKELFLKKEVVERNHETMSKIKEKYPRHEIVSLHLRRGDSDLTMYGGEKLSKTSNWFLYFENARKVLKGKKIKFLIFSGGNRITDESFNEYLWCRRNFVGKQYIFLDENRSTINDFALMQQCDHHILSPISSFSWWVGFLNTDNNKKIISPKKYWFLKKDLGVGFYPPNFILK